MLKPVELEIELFCRGMRLHPQTLTDPDLRINRTRAGLGSGLELILPSPSKPIWVNVPIVEEFAHRSPFELFVESGGFRIVDSRDQSEYEVSVPPIPDWYSRTTHSGLEMRRIGVLQG